MVGDLSLRILHSAICTSASCVQRGILVAFGGTTTRVTIQGKRILNSFDTNDLHQVVDVPTGHSAPHCDTFLVVLLLQKAD